MKVTLDTLDTIKKLFGMEAWQTANMLPPHESFSFLEGGKRITIKRLGVPWDFIIVTE